MAIEIVWEEDKKAERLLAALNLEYQQAKIKLSEIDRGASSTNYARFGGLQPQVVADIAEVISNGLPIPKVCVVKTPTGYKSEDGWHRINGIISLADGKQVAKDPVLQVYLIKTQDAVALDVFRRSANIGHGLRSSWDERIGSAMLCVREHGLHVNEVARLFNLSRSVLSSRIRAEALRTRLQGAGIAAEALNFETLERLNTVATDDAVVEKAAQAVIAYRAPAARLEPVVKRIRSAKSEKERMQAVTDFSRQLAKEARSGLGPKPRKKDAASDRRPPTIQKRPRREKLLRMLRELVEWLDTGMNGEPFQDLGQLQFSGDEDTALVRQLAGKLVFRLKVCGMVEN